MMLFYEQLPELGTTSAVGKDHHHRGYDQDDDQQVQLEHLPVGGFHSSWGHTKVEIHQLYFQLATGSKIKFLSLFLLIVSST